MEWIKVTERLPEFHQDCMFSNTDIKDPNGNLIPPSVHQGFYFENGKFKSWVDPRDNWNATHWMPLPSPPHQNKE